MFEFFFCFVFLYRKSIKIIKNTLKIEEKFSDVPMKFRVGPKKAGSVGFPEARYFLFSPYTVCHSICMFLTNYYIICSNNAFQFLVRSLFLMNESYNCPPYILVDIQKYMYENKGRHFIL